MWTVLGSVRKKGGRLGTKKGVFSYLAAAAEERVGGGVRTVGGGCGALAMEDMLGGGVGSPWEEAFIRLEIALVSIVFLDTFENNSLWVR